jgi:hypothetical protein
MTEAIKPDEILRILLKLNEAVQAQGQRIVALQTVSTMLLTELCMLSPTPVDTLTSIGARLTGTAVGVADSLRSTTDDQAFPAPSSRELTNVIDFIARVSERSLAERLAETQAVQAWAP